MAFHYSGFPETMSDIDFSNPSMALQCKTLNGVSFFSICIALIMGRSELK